MGTSKEILPGNSPFVTHADAYDGWYDTHQEIFLKQLDLIRPFITMGTGCILEVGCGSGRFSAALGIPYGIDLSRSLCEKAYNRGTGVIWGDGEALPVQTGVVSQVFLLTVLEFVHDPRNVLIEIHRSLISGGSLIVASLDIESNTGENYPGGQASSTFLSKAMFFPQADLIRLIEETGYLMQEIRRSAGLLLVSARKPVIP